MKGKPGKNPAFQMYPSDWLNDIELQSASFETIGIWANCLMLMWVAKNRGELSGTEQQLCKLIRCSKDEFERFLDEAQALLFCYVSRSNNNDITLRNRRMFREAEYREKAKENNRLRQQRFREKNACNGDVTPRHNDTSTSTSISTSISNNKNIARSQNSRSKKYDDDFLKFYDQYPNKKDKWKAQVAYRNAKKNGWPGDEEILSILKNHKESRQWKRDGGKYIPYPATWLNGRRWEDELEIDGISEVQKAMDPSRYRLIMSYLVPMMDENPEEFEKEIKLEGLTRKEVIAWKEKHSTK